MARTQVVMPQMGESITNGTITKWHKNVGDKIALDEILLEISTDKVESEIPSPVEGRVASLLYKEGDTIDVGKVIAEIEDDASAVIAAESKAATPTQAKAEPESKPVSVTETVSASASASSTEHRRFYTPLVRALAKEHNVPLSDLEKIKGSGAGGRVNREDFMNFIANKGASTKAAAATATTPATKPSAPGSVASVPSGARVEVIAMDNMRKAIAKNMIASKLTSPHVNSISEVDLTHLVKFRETFKDEFFKQEGIKLTYTPFILWAIIQALKEYPLVNSSVDGDNIIVKKDINLGCAVAVPGNGLVVPVIKNADTLNLTGICRMLDTLANKARARKLSMDDLSGGTFTFTNVGSFGTLLATPVILQPQVGIYASGVIQKRVVVMPDDSIAVRSMMYGTHTYDHRIIDGELGGKFLEAIHKNLRLLDFKSLF